jgi:hypothetical protein
MKSSAPEDRSGLGTVFTAWICPSDQFKSCSHLSTLKERQLVKSRIMIAFHYDISNANSAKGISSGTRIAIIAQIEQSDKDNQLYQKLVLATPTIICAACKSHYLFLSFCCM